jgi:hypothetical protein
LVIDRAFGRAARSEVAGRVDDLERGYLADDVALKPSPVAGNVPAVRRERPYAGTSILARDDGILVDLFGGGGV